MSGVIEFLKWPGAVSASCELKAPLVGALDLIAVSVCAITGVLVARGRQMDLIGLTVIAVVSALGGGSIRDVLLGKFPVFWVAQPLELVAAMLAGWLTFVVVANVRVSPDVFQIPDALGLALFTVVGAEKSLIEGHGWLVSAIMGVVTGVFGGVLRDIICREIPSIFMRTELYATASLAGGVTYVVSRGIGLPALASVLIGVSVVAIVRLAAIRWRWQLPLMRGE